MRRRRAASEAGRVIRRVVSPNAGIDRPGVVEAAVLARTRIVTVIVIVLVRGIFRVLTTGARAIVATDGSAGGASTTRSSVASGSSIEASKTCLGTSARSC